MNKDSVKKEIWDLHRKADQNRTINSLMLEKLERIQAISIVFLTVGSAISAILIFAELPSWYRLIPGFLTAVVFIVGLLINAFRINSKINERKYSVKIWGDWIREAQEFANLEIDILDDEKIENQMSILIIKYRKVMEEATLIPDSKFVKFKQKHLQKIELSKALDANPFKSIKELKKELSKKDKL